MVPGCMKEEVFQGCHDSLTGGHLGQQKTYERLKQHYMWHEMSVNAKLYVRTCSVCNRQKKSTVKPRAALGSYHAGAPMEKVHIDMLGPLPESQQGNKYVLLLVDQFTKWVEIHAVPDQSAERIAKVVVDQFFSRFGSPFQIHSDQGRNFDGNVFKAMCHLYRVTKTRTTPYRPCSNGQVERYNRLLLQLIRCYLKNKQSTWDENLQLLAAAIRAMPNRQTGFSANLLFLGREVNSPTEVVTGTGKVNMPNKDPAPYITSLRETLAGVGHLARQNLRSSQATQKRLYDLHIKEKQYDVGDVVYKLNAGSKTGESRKLKPVWIGPYVVVKVLSPALFRVKDRKGEYVVHHDRIKLCEDRGLPMWLKRLRHTVLEFDTMLPYEEDESDIPVVDNQTGLDDVHASLAELFKEGENRSSASEDELSSEVDTSLNNHHTVQEPSVEVSSAEAPTLSRGTSDFIIEEKVPETMDTDRVSRRGRTIKRPTYLADYQ